MAGLPSASDLTNVVKLPDEGLVQVLSKAAEAHPILTLAFVLVFMIVALGILALVMCVGLRYSALKSPEAARTIRAMDQDNKLFTLAMRRQKQVEREQKKKVISGPVKRISKFRG